MVSLVIFIVYHCEIRVAIVGDNLTAMLVKRENYFAYPTEASWI